VLYERIDRAYIFTSGNCDEAIKACGTFLALVSPNAQTEKNKLAIVKPGGDAASAGVEGIVEAYEYRRGKAYQKLGRHDEAIADFSKELSLEPKKTEYLEERAKAYQAKGMYDNAIADLTGEANASGVNISRFPKNGGAGITAVWPVRPVSA